MNIPFQASMSPGTLRFLRVLALAGAAISAVGLGFAPDRVWTSLLMAGCRRPLGA